MGNKKAARVVDEQPAGARAPVADRGEIALELGGEQLTLRPSHEAIDAFELATGKGLITLASESLNQRLRSGETAQIVAECVRAWGRETGNTSHKGASADKVMRLIMDGPGLYDVQRSVSAMLALATTGGYDSSGKMKPAPAMTTTTLPDTDAG